MNAKFRKALVAGIVGYLLLWVVLIASIYTRGMWVRIVAAGSIGLFLGHLGLFLEWAKKTSGDEEKKAWFQAGAIQRVYLITLAIVLAGLLR